MTSSARRQSAGWTISGGAEPHTDHEWSPFSLRERAESASKAGFIGLGLWHADLVHIRGKHSLAEMRTILDDNGIRHLELEFLTHPLCVDRSNAGIEQSSKPFTQVHGWSVFPGRE